MDSFKEINSLFVDIYNYIIVIEEKHMQKEGITDLTMSEIHVLEKIDKLEDKIMSKVAEELMITRGSLTTSVNKIIDKGYVTRNSVPGDKRKVILELTEKSHSVLKSHEEFHKNMIKAVIADHTDDKNIEILTKTLYNLRKFFIDMRNEIS